MTWRKKGAAAIEYPPEGMRLTGFRDPFVIQRKEEGRPWQLILGSGVKGYGQGTILLYESDDLDQGAVHKNTMSWKSKKQESSMAALACRCFDLLSTSMQYPLSREVRRCAM